MISFPEIFFSLASCTAVLIEFSIEQFPSSLAGIGTPNRIPTNKGTVQVLTNNLHCQLANEDDLQSKIAIKEIVL